MKLIKSITFFFLLLPKLIYAQAEIITISDSKQVNQIMLAANNSKDLFIFDIHNVILMPSSNLLKPCGQSMLDQFFSKFSNNSTKSWAMEKSILYSRKEIVVNFKTIELINSLIQNRRNLIFLSSYPTEIRLEDYSMERHRYKDLLSHSINIDQGVFFAKYKIYNQKNKKFAFFNNIIFSVNNSKAQALSAILKQINFKPTHIYFIDDRLKNLQQVMDMCVQHKINYTGLYYAFAQTLPCKLNYEVANKQLKILEKTNKWVDDDK